MLRLALCLALVLSASLVRADVVLIDDFESLATPAVSREPGQGGWNIVYRSGATVAECVTDPGVTGRVLRVSGQSSSYNIARRLPFSRISSYPGLSWKWKVVTAPRGADIRDSAKDDSAAQIYVSFDLKGTFWGYPLLLSLGYFYATAEDGAEPTLWEGFGSFVQYIPLRSVAVDGIGRWFAEERNVEADFARAVRDFLDAPDPAMRRKFRKALEHAAAPWGAPGSAPPELDLHSIAIWVDSNDTRSSAESLYDDIVFSTGAAGGSR